MKGRLDLLLVSRKLADSRTQARGLIMAGSVYVDGRRVDKPGTSISPQAHVEVRGNPIPYVSRGGLKLAKALAVFSVTVKDQVVLDVGASTGGFTDCLLQHGAARVIALDVGYGQLAWRLRQDERVVVMERTNIRHVVPGDLPTPVDLVTVDVAFISLTKVLPVLMDLLIPNGRVIALIKPQFEAGQAQVGKGGVVREAKIHTQVITKVLDHAAGLGLGLVDLTFSPVTGPEGNLEFLALWQKQALSPREDYTALAATVVQAAHGELIKGG